MVSSRLASYWILALSCTGQLSLIPRLPELFNTCFSVCNIGKGPGNEARAAGSRVHVVVHVVVHVCSIQSVFAFSQTHFTAISGMQMTE